MEKISTLQNLPIPFKSYKEFETYKIRCRACYVGKIYDKVVLSIGNKINPKVVIIGEACGSSELLSSPPQPFIGKAGQLLREVIKEFGFTKFNSLITNTIPCRPEDNKFPTDDNIVKSCKNVWLKEELRLTNPDILLLIGAKPLKFLLSMEGITRIRGKWIQKRFNNKIIKIMPTYHSSFVLRKQYMDEGKEILQQFRNDIKEVAKAAGFC